MAERSIEADSVRAQAAVYKRLSGRGRLTVSFFRSHLPVAPLEAYFIRRYKTFRDALLHYRNEPVRAPDLQELWRRRELELAVILNRKPRKTQLRAADSKPAGTRDVQAIRREYANRILAALDRPLPSIPILERPLPRAVAELISARLKHDKAAQQRKRLVARDPSYLAAEMEISRIVEEAKRKSGSRVLDPLSPDPTVYVAIELGLMLRVLDAYGDPQFFVEQLPRLYPDGFAIERIGPLKNNRPNFNLTFTMWTWGENAKKIPAVRKALDAAPARQREQIESILKATTPGPFIEGRKPGARDREKRIRRLTKNEIEMLKLAKDGSLPATDRLPLATQLCGKGHDVDEKSLQDFAVRKLRQLEG